MKIEHKGSTLMNPIPVIGFAGYSGAGKTTLIERLIGELKGRGQRVAVIKHHGHEEMEFDRQGKDSFRFTQAGADISIVSSPKKTAYIEQRSLEFQNLISLVHDVDIILVEGFKKEPIVQIGVCYGKAADLPENSSRYLALVTDKKEIETSIPVFSFEQIESLCDFILKQRRKE